MSVITKIFIGAFLALVLFLGYSFNTPSSVSVRDKSLRNVIEFEYGSNSDDKTDKLGKNEKKERILLSYRFSHPRKRRKRNFAKKTMVARKKKKLGKTVETN
jgi:hypothetical protein